MNSRFVGGCGRGVAVFRSRRLPAAKQRGLERIFEVIFEEFRQATENATGGRKGAHILKIILFGGPDGPRGARGFWVSMSNGRVHPRVRPVRAAPHGFWP